MNLQTMNVINVRSVITTREDRLDHIEQCRKWDMEWQAEQGGNIPSERHYENVGDIASTNDWYYHDTGLGHLLFYADSPDWNVDGAVKRCWISERGERKRQ